MPEILRFETDRASDTVLAEVRGLLDAAFDGEFSDDDWDHAVGGCHIVAIENDSVIAHAAVVPRTLEIGEIPVHTGYVEAVATDARYRRQAIGASIMEEAARHIRNGYELGALSTGLTDFYARLGWELWRGPTFVRDRCRLVRTEEEDGGVMVLRFGRHEHLDLSERISCEVRSGDDW